MLEGLLGTEVFLVASVLSTLVARLAEPMSLVLFMACVDMDVSLETASFPSDVRSTQYRLYTLHLVTLCYTQCHVSPTPSKTY